MRPPEDVVLLRDMLDHARKAIAAARGRSREDLDHDITWDVVVGDLPRLTTSIEKTLEGT